MYNIKEYEGLRVSMKLKGIQKPLKGRFISSGFMVDCSGSLVHIDGVFRIDDDDKEADKTEVDIAVDYIESIEIIE